MSFAKRIVDAHPSWQIMLVDLRCHGESKAPSDMATGPNTVVASAADILALLRQLRLFPHILIGHSFGGEQTMNPPAVAGRPLTPLFCLSL